jgi:hypothetical protein
MGQKNGIHGKPVALPGLQTTQPATKQTLFAELLGNGHPVTNQEGIL